MALSAFFDFFMKSMFVWLIFSINHFDKDAPGQTVFTEKEGLKLIFIKKIYSGAEAEMHSGCTKAGRAEPVWGA